MFRKLFFDHPASVGETYFEHLRMALGFGLTMVVGGLACIVHAVLPCAFVRTGSRTIVHLHDVMVRHRNRKGTAVPEPQGTDTRLPDALEWTI